MENKKTFGEYILEKRKDAGLTQKSFAEKLYVTESAVSKWERGISYPDISLVQDICETLGVSEKELLTASEDTQTRTNEKLANRYIKSIRRKKRAQLIFYGIVLLICLICNLVNDHTLSWFFIALPSVMILVSLTLLPILVDERRRLVTFLGFTVSLLLLLLACDIYTGGDWFIIAAVSVVFSLCLLFLPIVLKNIGLPEELAKHKALLCIAVDTVLLFVVIIVASIRSGDWLSFSENIPDLLLWLSIPWGIMLVIRYTRINRFFKTAACIGIFNLVFILSNGLMLMALDGGYTYLGVLSENNVKLLIYLVLMIIMLIFIVAGIVADLSNKRMAQKDKD